MKLTEEIGLRAYAKMMNNLDPQYLEPFLSDDFIFESQQVLQPIISKKTFLEYIHPKLNAIRKANALVYAEMGTIDTFERLQSCVILAQNEKENLIGLAFARTDGNLIKRIDLCIVPSPFSAKRSGDYPV